MVTPSAKWFQVNWFSVNRVKIHPYLYLEKLSKAKMEINGIFFKSSRLTISSWKQDIYSFVPFRIKR